MATNDIGEDILEVLEELGSSVNVYKYSDESDNAEYVDTDYEVNQVYPWTSHFVIKCSFAYNTVAEPGDLVTFDTDTNYLLVALAKERFENLCIAKEGILYLTNVFAQVQRRSEERVDYELIVTWPIVYSGELALFTGDATPSEIQKEKYGMFVLQKDRLYISDEIDVQGGDRLWLKESMDVSGEAREVLSIEDKKFPGIKICLLGLDTRE